MKDAVDAVMAQWRRERPDLDLRPVGVIGRLQRLHRVVEQDLREFFAAHGLGDNEFDVLATLRRSGEPYEMSAGAFLRAALVTSGTLTHRVDRLVAKGLVERTRPEEDRRVVRIRLTEAGLALVDDVVGRHLANEARLLSALDDDQLEGLTETLRTLLIAHGDTVDRQDAAPGSTR